MRIWKKYKGSSDCDLRSKVLGRKTVRGFTLIELLVVIAIIAISMGIAIPALQRAINRAKQTRARSEVLTLQQAWQAYWNTYYDAANNIQPPFWSDTAMDPSAVRILAGEDTGANPLEIPFMEFDERHIREGFLDPWGEPYEVELGNDSTDIAGWEYGTRFFLGNGARGKY